MPKGYLTTHVLDTALGLPAEGIRVTLNRLDGSQITHLTETVTNADGRTDSPVLPEEMFAEGNYELIFDVGPYLRSTGQSGDILFLEQIPIRFGMSAPDHYHVPLLLSPFSYSTYRGS